MDKAHDLCCECGHPVIYGKNYSPTTWACFECGIYNDYCHDCSEIGLSASQLHRSEHEKAENSFLCLFCYSKKPASQFHKIEYGNFSNAKNCCTDCNNKLESGMPISQSGQHFISLEAQYNRKK